MKKDTWVVHVIATCYDCGKEFCSHKNGQALAAIHAEKYKHLVHGNVELIFNYNGKI